MSKYEELKYVLSGATDWGYEYAKKEDVEAAFAELEERHAMELDQWVLELGKMKLEKERLKKLLFNAQKAASDAKLSAHEKSRRIDELKAENESLKYSVATLDTDIAMMKKWRKVSEELPEVEEDYGEIFLVAVAVETEKKTKGSYVTSAEFCNGEWYNDSTGNEIEENIEREDCFYRSKITHWMPLPKAPKEAK